MRLKKIQEALKTKNIIFTYTEEDNCGSLVVQFRGLRYHIWEFVVTSGAWRQMYIMPEKVRILPEITKKRSAN